MNPSSALCPLAQRVHERSIARVERLAPGTIGREVLGAGAMDRIHAENVARLAALNPFEVERERRELLSQLEPQLVAFLRARRMRTEHTAAPAAGDERDTSAKKPKQEPSAAAAAARRTSDSGSESESESESNSKTGSEAIAPVDDHSATRAAAQKPVLPRPVGQTHSLSLSCFASASATAAVKSPRSGLCHPPRCIALLRRSSVRPPSARRERGGAREGSAGARLAAHGSARGGEAALDRDRRC